MVKGYIYTMFKGADPGKGWQMTDPIFTPVPTIGACVPQIRRSVVPGDHVFVVSGRMPSVQQFVVGGFQVADKIDALAAYDRFPQNRLVRTLEGRISGNIIVEQDGSQNPLDYHGEFNQRIRNYIVGRDAVVLETAGEIERGRNETMAALGELFGKTGQKVHDVMGRWRRLDEGQIAYLLGWLKSIKASEA